MANVLDFVEPGPLLSDEVVKPPILSNGHRSAVHQQAVSALDSRATRRGCGDVPDPRAAVMPSEPFEALELAPALTEANVFHACPELSCFNAAKHRRHGERHLAEDISCRFFGLNKGIDARDQNKLSLISCLSLHWNCCKRECRHSNQSRFHQPLVVGI